MPRTGTRTLLHILAVRVAIASAGAFAVLFVFFFVEYMVDIPALRHATLQADLGMVLRALERGEDPASFPQYRHQPAAYAFRVRGQEPDAAAAGANAELLPGAQAAPPGADTIGAGLLERSFDRIARPGGQEALWMLTERASLAGRPVWIQLAMIGDPEWRWRGVIQREMLDHVAIPALVIIPTLALAVFLAMRHALHPLLRITHQAEALAGAVFAGRAMSKLPEAGLPLDFRRVVIALNAMLAKLEQSLRQQKQFTADAAHQLRTPLAILMLEVSQLPHEPLAARIAGELEALARLVNQLLRFAQAEDAMAGERQTVDVAAVARQACEALAPLALSRGVEIAFDAPDAALRTLGHAALVDAAVTNIVDNALRHSPAGGVVSVLIGAGPRVVVEDRGPGVPEAMKERVFDRFCRATNAAGEGSGIGLALARRVAQLHGGEIRVEDRAGGGARFVLSFAPVA